MTSFVRDFHTGIRFLTRSLAVGVTLLFVVAGCDSKTAAQHLQDAEANFTAGDLRVAEIELKNAIQKDPKLGPARALLGQLHYKNGDLASALKEFERAIDSGHETEETRLFYLRTKLALGRFSEVVGELEEANVLEPEFAVVLASAYLMAGDLEKSRPLMQQGAHLPEGLLGLAMIAQTENDLDRALSFAARAVSLDETLTRAWLYKGELELGSNADDALSSYRKAQSLPGGEIQGGIGVVRAHLVNEDTTAASAAIETLLEKAGKYPPVQYLHGLIRFREGNFDAAETALQIVQQSAPDHPPTLYLMGLVKSQQGQWNQAADSLKRYLAGDEDSISARKLLASVYAEVENFAGIVEVLEPYAIKHSDPQVWAMLGSAFIQEGNMSRATQALQQAVALAPDMAPFRNQLAVGLLSAGDESAALEELEAAIELDGDQFQSDYIRVMFEIRRGDMVAAAEAVEGLIAKSPDVPIGHNLKGGIALANGDTATARISFAKALEVDPSYFPATQSLARLEENAGNVSAARKIYEDAVASNRQSEEAGLGLVDFLARTGEVELALDQLGSIVLDHPDSIRARVGQLRLLLATRRISEAETAARQLMNIAEDVPDALLLKAQVDLASGNQTAARMTAGRLQQMVDQYENNAVLMAAVGELQLRTGSLTLARSNLESALKLEGAPLSARVNLARLELAEGNPRSAAAQLNELEKAGVDFRQVGLLRGDVLVASGRIDEAAEHFRRLADEGSRAATMRYVLAEGRRGEFDVAKARLNEWIAENPKDTGMKMVLANVGIQQGDLGFAKKQYEKMLPSNDPVLLNNLAWIYMEEGNPRAEEIARRAHSVMPDNPDISDTLGWILVQKGSTQEGLGYLRTSARAKPQEPTVQYHLAFALHKAGDNSAAQEALQRALSAQGNFEGRADAEALMRSLNS